VSWHSTSGGSKGWPRGRGAFPDRALDPCAPMKLVGSGFKIARLHNSCIHGVKSRSWCQITPLTQSYSMSSGIFAPSPPQATQTAAAKNAPVLNQHALMSTHYGNLSP